MTVKHLYPNSTPALNLNFKSSRVVDPRIRCIRSTTATYVDPVSSLIKTAAANEVRVDKNGLLVEESRTNLIPESTNLNNTTHWHTSTNPGSLNQSANAGWMVATANTTEVVSPDGTNNACKLSGLTTTTFDKNYKVHVVPNSGSVSLSANVVYTFTLFVKDPDSVFNGDNDLRLMYGSKFSNTNAVAIFDLSNDTVTFGGDIANESASITPYPNGWKKLTATFTNTNSGGGPRYYLQEISPKTGTVNGYSATQFSLNGEKFYVWGFQIEQGSFGTSYMPTAGSTVTRNADELSFLNNNLTSWHNNSQGSFLIDINVLGSGDDYPRLFQTNQSHNFEYQTLNSAPTSAALAFQGWLSGQVTKTPYGAAPLPPVEFKTAANYSIGSISSIYIDGTEQVRSFGNNAGTAQATAPTELRLCRQSGGNQYLSSYVKRLVFYQTTITNTALEALTQ